MHKKIRELSNKKKSRSEASCILDKNGKLLFDKQEIEDRWVEYITQLYNNNRGQMRSFDKTTGESILKSEVENTIKSMKSGKASGPDEIATEMLKALDESSIDIITELCNIIYNSGYIPTEMEQSSFITLPKKSKAQKSTEFRTISLMSHITKLLLKIIQQRIATRIDQEISELQSGFRKGSGTREGIFKLRTICERTIAMQKDVYICFIDYTKAFDRVNHTKMIECLSVIGVDDKDLQIITKLYWEQTAVVRTDNVISKEFKIKKGVRQGCVLSPTLFNLYTEKIFREMGDMKGVIIGGLNINNSRYADDTSLITSETAHVQDLLTAVNNSGKPYGMEINVKKIKGMAVSNKSPAPRINIIIDGTPIEQVSKMVYLGHLATDDGKSEQEIKRRIEIARSTFTNMSKLLTSRNISTATRMRATKCYIWSTLLYGAETWSISKKMMTKIEAFEMWVYRRVLRIPWTAHKTNKEVLDIIGSKTSLIKQLSNASLHILGI